MSSRRGQSDIQNCGTTNMLDFIGFIITTALMVVVVNTLIIFIDAARAAKVTLAAVFGLWIGLAAAAAEAGWLPVARPIPVVGIFVAVPLLAAALAATWPPAREAMLSIPMPVMIALNIVRVFAVFFLMLAAEGRLTGPFPYSAAWSDIITGVVAVPALWFLKDGVTRHTTAIAAWNLFCTAYLVLAIAFGITSALPRQRARLCSYSVAPARKRCNTRPGHSSRRCWYRSGSSFTGSSPHSFGALNWAKQ